MIEKLEKPYTLQQRAEFVHKHKSHQVAQGLQAIYALESYEKLITDLGKDKIVDRRGTPEYEQSLLNNAKQKLYSKIDQARALKLNGEGSTITINLPSTLDDQEVKSFKLLVNTTSGSLDTVLATLKDCPKELLTDVLVDYEGKVIRNLGEEIELAGSTNTRIYFIWLQYFMAKSAITEYVRQLNSAILKASTIEEIEAIKYDFDKF